MDISPQHAQHIVDEMKRSIHRDMNIMNCQGIIIASTNPSRCGQLHQGASQLIAQGLRQKTVWQDDPAQGVQAGINLPIVITGELAGVIGITKSAARELASRGITVNAVAPGFIATEMTDVLSDSVKAAATEQIPMKHFGSTQDIAETVAFLASDKAGYITGQVLSVDGGMAM